MFLLLFIFKCFYYYVSYKFYSYLNIDKTFLLKRLYKFIIRLGPLFVKVFQNISDKNILPTDIYQLSEQSKDSVYYDNNDYMKIMENIKQTGFEPYGDDPIAAGSICLVYKGVYKSKPSIIKICHSNIFEKMNESVYLIQSIISFCSHFNIYHDLIKQISFDKIIEDVKMQIDLKTEVNNLENFKKDLEKYRLSDIINVPEIYDYSNNYIIESYISGLTYHDFIKKHKTKTYECLVLIRILTRLQMLYFDICHGDLHSSNYLYSLKDDKVILNVFDFGLCIDTKSKDQLFFRKIMNTFYIPELLMIHPFSAIIGYIKLYPMIVSCLTERDFPYMYDVCHQLFQNIPKNKLLKHVYTNIEDITRKQVLGNIQMDFNYFEDGMEELFKLIDIILKQNNNQLDLSSVFVQNGITQSYRYLIDLKNNEKYCDVDIINRQQSIDNNVQINFSKYQIYYLLENDIEDEHLEIANDNIQLAHQHIIFLFQDKYTTQLNKTEIKSIIEQFSENIKEYIFQLFYRNKYYIQRKIMIDSLFHQFFLESDMLHGMIEYLLLKKPNGLRKGEYTIPIKDINVSNILTETRKMTYNCCEKGIFKGDEIIKLDDKPLQEDVEITENEILKCKTITFKDCFSLI